MQKLQRTDRSKSRSYSKNSIDAPWNRLHALSKDHIETREKNWVESYYKKQQDELKECTFRPQITEYRNISIDRSPDAFYERNKMWKEEKDRRISLERDNKRYDQQKE